MLSEKRVPTHPGEILLLEFLTPMGLTQVDFATHLRIPIQRVNEIIKGKRGVTPETAWLLSGALGTTPEFWLNLQAAHDLARTQPKNLAPIADLRARVTKPVLDTAAAARRVRVGGSRRSSRGRA
ncbi:MAG: HigA family addiction module antitoxin [Acidobacteriota bacterium]|nr:HigA family addiction module antitoxin [Acidobacteriota bacterium]MDQ5873530.1 HigA family addiction module antitoxin [Acidobacteriota bacterium]